MTIQVYMTCPTTEALGPYKRYALWVQGCNKRCPGCISPEAQPLSGGIVFEVEKLVSEIIAVQCIEGITISGGEPFLQQDALCELIDRIHEKRDFGVIVYTGMLYEEVQHTELAHKCDLMIDGAYVEALNDDKSLRGSSNQNVICVTDRYRDIVQSFYGQAGRKVELIQRDGRLDMVGIPSKNTAMMF